MVKSPDAGVGNLDPMSTTYPHHICRSSGTSLAIPARIKSADLLTLPVDTAEAATTVTAIRAIPILGHATDPTIARIVKTDRATTTLSRCVTVILQWRAG
jgi:hypothetical protein